MKKNKQPGTIYRGTPQVVLILWLLASLFLVAVSRLLLFFFNTGLFPGNSLSSLFRYFITGLRFDIPAVLYGNILLIVLMLLPFRFRHLSGYYKLSRILFLISGAILLIPNLVDLVYYRFTMKRLTGDIFSYLSVGMDSGLIFQFLHDFWYVFLLWIGCILILVWFSRRITIRPGALNGSGYVYFSGQLILTLFFSGLVILGMRGGLQLKPVSILTASEYAETQNVPLVLNSAFTIMKTLDQKGLDKKEYFPREQLDKIFNPEHQFVYADSTGQQVSMNKLNVVVIILESFSREHFGAYNVNLPEYKGFTPFLDSLIQHSLSFNGFANGKRSIEGIPAILSGLPTWMDQDFITSMYASNKTESLAGLLRKQGYQTAFFHGGTNGTMGFDQYARSTGFDKYFGRSEYDNDSDFDGKWGIWDEPFLKYFAKQLDKMHQPFLASVFTLSSHHPYRIPDKFRGKFRKGVLPIQETVMYTDYALKEFFHMVCTMPWYKNTLFVITADHTSEAALPAYKTRVGQYRIPVLFYQPEADTSYMSQKVMQQTDIMPSILDYLHFPSPFVAFGNSVFSSKTPGFSLSRFNGNYQLIAGAYVYDWNQENSSGLFNYETDPYLTKDVSHEEKEKLKEMETLMKAVIQQYDNRMIENRLTVH